ncbi:hypothetical protein, partial [Escherichia coli]|uniref:hypothetical protein n=1 Tax=Escherichia coli TaxID=562 RepID=UPI002B2447E8
MAGHAAPPPGAGNHTIVTMAADGAPWEDHVMMMSQLAQVVQLAVAWLSAPQELPPGTPCNTPVTPMEE